MAAQQDVTTFTRPIQRIVVMIFFLALVGVVAGVLFVEIKRVFNANRELNGLIVLVFVIGVFMAFYQVFRLFSAVNWIEALAVRARGIESISPPGLLVAMDPLRKNVAAEGVGATTSRVILDSISTRMDESRDSLRYVGGLLIFLGLLGTFWGLAKTVPAVVDTIRAIQPQGDEEGVALFEKLMSGLDSQLAGMGVAFASSLLGLAGSLVVGFLELMSAGAQNRFYSELEAWLSSRTRLSAHDGDGMSAGAGDVADRLGFVAQQMAALNRLLGDSEQRRVEENARLSEAVRSLEAVALESVTDRETVLRSLDSQERVIGAIEQMVEKGGGGGGMDTETRRHIRNIDILLAKLIEESAAGRVETAEALRRELRSVSRAVNEVGSALNSASVR
jgi:hypothetical protein